EEDQPARRDPALEQRFDRELAEVAGSAGDDDSVAGLTGLRVSRQGSNREKAQGEHSTHDGVSFVLLGWPAGYHATAASGARASSGHRGESRRDACSRGSREI